MCALHFKYVFIDDAERLGTYFIACGKLFAYDSTFEEIIYRMIVCFQYV